MGPATFRETKVAIRPTTIKIYLYQNITSRVVLLWLAIEVTRSEFLCHDAL